MTEPRRIVRVLKSVRTREGAGFAVRRPFPVASVDQIDPFLLLDEMGPVTYAPAQSVGAPDHPHRGFETVTYILDGETEHEDSEGRRGAIGPGAVQWMTAGRGIIHSEMPSRAIQKEGGRIHGFQLWVNLRARDKMMAPRYQEVPAARVPKASSADGLAHATVIAGSALGVDAVIETRTPIAYHDWTLLPGARVEVELPRAFHGFVFIFGGAAEVGEPATPIVDGDCAMFNAGASLSLRCAVEHAAPARLLVIAGEPIKEPLVRHGPFVMNTAEEIRQAFNDYRLGRLGQIRR